MKSLARALAFFLFATVTCAAQLYGTGDANTLRVSGDADVKVVPDRVNLMVGVENRNKDLNAVTSQNDATVREVIAAVRKLGVDASDIQTDFVHVDLTYDKDAPTVIAYYSTTKAIQIVLKDVSKFEALLNAILQAGANHVYGIDFATSELRKYRDEARALAAKAAIEKAHDIAATAGLRVSDKPLYITTYSYGGGSSYGYCCGGRFYPSYNNNMAVQNVVQEEGGGSSAAAGTVALGKINVTATVEMTFRIER